MQKGPKFELIPEPIDELPRYKKIRDLSGGSSAYVQLARDRQKDELVARYFIRRGDKVTRYLEREILNHRYLPHPHIIQFKEVFLTPQYLGIATEYMPGGDLFTYVMKKNGLRESHARWFFQQLIVGLDCYHKTGVSNRDIRLENMLLDTKPHPILKICDFGYTKLRRVDELTQHTSVSSTAHLPPEVLVSGPRHCQTYNGKAADVWRCGVVLYVMLVGAYPFQRPEDKTFCQKMRKMIQRILVADYKIPGHIKISPDGQDLLSRMFVADPEKRITIQDIYNHPWYNNNLPPGVKEMNDRPHPLSEGLQTVGGISRIVQEARKPTYDAYSRLPDIADYPTTYSME